MAVTNGATMSDDTTPVTFRFPRAVVDDLDAAAEAENRSRNAQALTLLQRALADHAAAHREAMRRYEAVAAGDVGRLVPRPYTEDAER